MKTDQYSNEERGASSVQELDCLQPVFVYCSLLVSHVIAVAMVTHQAAGLGLY